MSAIMFEQFKSLLSQLVNDSDVVRKNSILQDASYRTSILDRISILDPSVSLVQDYSDALIPSLGMMFKDPSNRTIRFDPKGFSIRLSAFREGTVDNPVKIWFKAVDSGDGTRYILADRTNGVFLLNSEVEVLKRFPDYGPITTTEYNDPSAVCTFTINSVEYVAITLYSHHICQIYLYNDPFTHIATIGTLDTPGDTSAFLYNPVGIAVDEANTTLYILNENGTPPGATLDRGFISVYDISTVATPTHTGSPWFYKNTGSLLDKEIETATDIFYDVGSTLLWVSNGNNEVGGFDLSTTTNQLAKYIEPSGPGYTLRAPQQVYVKELLGGYKRIYIANGNTGTVEEYDFLTLSHLNSFGYRASEDELSGYNRLSDTVYGAVGFPTGITTDRILVDGTETDVLIVADNLNKRVHRFNLNAYTADNYINFALMELAVPVSLYGWAISGTVPLDMVTVYYRFAETEEFRILPQETNTPPSSTFQFRIVLQLDPRRFVSEWRVDHLRVHATQV